MKNIIPNITTLSQYVSSSFAKIKIYCSHCGSYHVWRHGHYYRKCDRSGQLNPISIQRFLCRCCKRTFSVLPECIPPQRWYLWDTQQSALILWLKKMSYKSISKKLLPDRKTISRWISRLHDKFLVYADHLKTLSQDFCSCSFDIFWHKCLYRWRLSEVMLIMNNAGIVVP